MVENWLFIFAVIAVLLIPGPTNALLATSAHLHGFYHALSYVPLVMLGYAYGISLWALIIHLGMPTWPHLMQVLHGISMAYVIWLAVHLWKKTSLQQHSQKHQQVDRSELFKSTLKNPKSLLFAAGIFPTWTWDSFQNYSVVLVIFMLGLIPCTLFWMFVGRRILAGEIASNIADRLYKGTAMLLMLSMLPIVIEFF